jgi:hypothetical protein
MNSLFLVVLGLSLLVDLALGAWAGAKFPHFANTWGLGGVAPASAAPAGVAHFLGWVLATCLIGFAAIQGIAFHWTRRGKDEGPQLAIVFGCWLVLSSLATFAFVSLRGSGSEFASMGLRFLVVDGLRGAVLTVLGFLALRAPSVVRELRLPDGARQPRHREERMERPRSERSRQDHRDDRPRRRDERREERGRSGGGHVGRGRDERQRHSAAGHGPQRGDAPQRGHAEQRREEPHRGAQPPRAGRDPRGARQSPVKGGTGIAADLESRAVAEARRILPDPAERPLKVVVRGAPERFRAPAPDDSRMAEPLPVLPPAVPPSGGVPPAGAGEAVVAGEGGGRRRRRRRPRGGAGSAEPRFEESFSSSGYDDLDEPVVVEREIEERGGGDSGEGQEGESAVRGRNRRRRRPTPS